MPISMDKDVRFSFVLLTDRVKEENVPTFYFSGLTVRAWRNLNKRAQAMDKKQNIEDALDELISMITDHLVDWENMTDPKNGQKMKFNKKKLGDLITMNEGWDLIQGIKNQGVEVKDRKNSSSPSKSSKV